MYYSVKYFTVLIGRFSFLILEVVLQLGDYCLLNGIKYIVIYYVC
jgi:hypothetical protein